MTESTLNAHLIRKIKEAQGAEVYALHKDGHRVVLTRVGTYDEVRCAVNVMACLLNGLAAKTLEGFTEKIGGVAVGVLHNHLCRTNLKQGAENFFRYAQAGLSDEAHTVGYLAWHGMWVSGTTQHVAGMKHLEKSIGPLLDLVYGSENATCVSVGETAQVSLKLRLKDALALAEKTRYTPENMEFFTHLIGWTLNARRLMLVHEMSK